uniref:uncharacterized protein LOC122601053 n=1 Tax=Erigeron canadensis TaxID=72917 RepID=UPI001CB89168|nr:uncharacterized protein LOC122601053 [Erigeron canadensis]
MVHFMSSENNNNVWQLPEEEMSTLVGDESLMFLDEPGREDEPLRKRWRPSSSSSQMTTDDQELGLSNNKLPVPQYEYNPLDEPSPLGLRLRKSPSLLELAQRRLNEVNNDKAVENLEARTKRRLKARTRARASGSLDKLKASHFPALLLRIGQWEYVSKHEGDLMAKCYFSKHKIVWEVLDGGLKKKFEINWADIMGLKASCASDGPGSLTIVLDKQPLFFKEINPQPRKHTQWRATSDFTDGEASTHRQHFLQCAQGVLDKHYEKLIQCDTRLNFLSQQQDIALDFPYFPPKPSIKDQDILGNSDFNLSDIYNIAHMGSPSTLHKSSLSKTIDPSSLSLIPQDMSREVHSSSSGMSTEMEGQKDIEQLNAPRLKPTLSISDFINYVGNNLSEQRNLPFSDSVLSQEIPKDMLENISEILLGDSQLTTASDEKTLMSRVNSLCCLLQDRQKGHQDGNVLSTHDHNLSLQQEKNGSSTSDSIIMPGNTIQDGASTSLSAKLPQDYLNDSSTPGSSQIAQQDGNASSNLESNPISETGTPLDGPNQESGLSRNDSYADLVHHLPRITSLPRFLFDISENGEILK